MMHQCAHSEECAFICEACNKSFPEDGNLQIHQHTHGGVRPLTCDVCNKSFMEQDNLKIHQRTVESMHLFLTRVISHSQRSVI